MDVSEKIRIKTLAQDVFDRGGHLCRVECDPIDKWHPVVLR